MGCEMCNAKRLGKTQAAMVWEEAARGPADTDVKPRYSLVPAWALEQVALALTLGAEKHADDDFRTVSPEDSGRTTSGEFDAAMRHWAAYTQGEWLDDETGVPHVAAAATRMMIACELALEGRE